MSWLSTSLSENLTNITGQISTFTKDMLTEGTVEVDDHETELKIAKSHVRELELTLYTQREEYDRVKELNHELQERVEAAELQITSISHEYRTLLQEKENEVAQLREQLENWKEHELKHDREHVPSFSEDSFVDGMDEVQHLKTIVSKLQEEKIQWSQNHEKENLHKELDHYQHELATLHATYSQRIAALNKKHKQEVEELESCHQENSQRIQELEEQLAETVHVRGQNVVLENLPESESDFEIIKKESAERDLQLMPDELSSRSDNNVNELKILIDGLECENRDLKEKMNRVEVQTKQKDVEIARLQDENNNLTEQLNQAMQATRTTENNSESLKQQNKNGTEIKSIELTEIACLQQENKELNKQLNEALQASGTNENNSEITRLQQENKELTEQRDQAVISEAQTSASLESLREELSRLGMVTMELMKEVEQSQGVEKEKSIEIESLKKLCQVRRASEERNPEEVVKLKDMLAVLWQKYSSVVLENQKVRLEVLNIKRRLLNQLQDRHGDTKSVLDGISEARTKLFSHIEGQREEIVMERQQLISIIPDVENEVESHEENVSRLIQENDNNKSITKDIVSDFGRRWSVSNHVASLQAEKAVLERTIVGLEEKVQELEQLLAKDTPRSSISTVISVDSIRAAPYLSGTSDNGALSGETGPSGTMMSESGGLVPNEFGGYNNDILYDDECKEYNAVYDVGDDDEERDKDNKEYSKDNKDYNKNDKEYHKDYDKLMEQLKEYEETIAEFELIKEDWEGEKEALENVLVDLRKKLKDLEKNKGSVAEKRYLGEIEELLIKKNYISEGEIRESCNREDVLLFHVLQWLRRELVEESIVVKQQNDVYYSGVGPSETEPFMDVPNRGRDEGALSENVDVVESSEEAEDKHEINATKNELDATRNECSKMKHEVDETKHELDEVNTRLNDTRNELDNIREKSRVDLENAKVVLDQANERALDFESKLKLLKSELDESHVNFNNTLSEKDNEIHKLRHVVEQLQETLSNFENGKAKRVTELQQEIASLERELGSATSSCETMATKLEESKQELRLVLDVRETLAVQISEIVKEKEQLLGMVNDRDARIEELQDLSDSVDQRVSFLLEEGEERSRALSELSEENSLLKEEKADLCSLLEAKENELNTSLREAEKLSELLREQELASEEMKRQNIELAKDLENWRIQLEELNETKEALSRELDLKSEEILSLKENNIELANQSNENNLEISEKLSMLEQLIGENLALKSENASFMEALSQKKISEKELKDSYNLLVQEREQLDETFSKKSSEMDVEIRRKIDEVEVLRLEVARLTKEAQEKDHMIRAQMSANLVGGGDDNVTARQEQLRRILQEKDLELDALRTKNESLLTLFADNEEEKDRVSQEHDKQIASMLQREKRMLHELNEKSDRIIALEDRLEMLNIKSASKDQASALMHAEYQKLLSLNESQSEEIGRLRERVAGLGLLVAERDRNASGEWNKLRQRNSDLQLQVDALQGEQERLLMLVHDKDKQLSTAQDSPVKRTQEQLVNTPPSVVEESSVRKTKEVQVNTPPSNPARNEAEVIRLIDENETLTQEIHSLRNNVASLNDSIENERNINRTLAEQNNVINQRLRSLEAAQVESGNTLRKLRLDNEKLRDGLSSKERQIFAEKEEINRKVYEINTLRNEKDEIFLEQSSQVQELQTKLSSLLDVITNDEGFKEEQFEILENREDFERLLTKIKNHRSRLLSDKDHEVKLLKEQVETLSSVQNISNPELERKLEKFIQEKDEMNQRVLEMENEKIELLEEKENEMTSLQGQIVDLSNVLKLKERQWSAERETFSDKNSLLEKRTRSLEQERESLNENKTKLESEVLKLREEVALLTTSADQKLDVVLHEKDRRVKELERELEGLKQRHLHSRQEAQDMKNELDSARKLAQELELKKEKELERLRTHLLQVEDSYTQEALASEERENELRNQLEQIHQQLLSSSHSLQDSNRTASMKMENLKEQLINLTAHRDELQTQLEQSQEQTLQYMKSVENLQMVLEQFQREKESELKSLREKNQEHLSEAQKEIASLRERERELQQLLQNASDALNKADRLSNDLKTKEEEIENLKLTVSNLESDLQSSHDKLRKLTSNNDGKIEKGLMKNMLLAYFNTSEHKRSDVVAVLGHILNFSEEEIKKIGTGSHPPQAAGWLSGLLSYSGSNTSQHQHDKSFSELFVSFLEKESENNLISQSSLQPPISAAPPSSFGTRATTAVMAIPAKLRDSPLPISPLASSTPSYGNAKAVTNPLLKNAKKDEAANGSDGIGADTGNALLGPSLRPSLDLPTITNSSSSSTSLRQILFNN